MLQPWIHVLSVVALGLAVVQVGPTRAFAADSSNEFVEQIVQLLANPDREFRAAALEQVRKSARGTAATQTFAAQLSKLDPSAQAELITALGDRGDVAARSAVVELLASSKDEHVRSAALAALGQIGGAEDVPTLITTLTASGAEQQAARTALVRMRGDFVAEKLAADVKAGTVPARSTLIDLLAERRASGQMGVLVAASVDDDGGVRGAAMNALGKLAGAAQVGAMIPGVLRAQKGGERDAAERNVAAVCARIENEDQRADALITALNGVDAAQRDQLLSLVGRVGGKRLINFVGDIATGSDAARRRLAIDALSKWPDASPADKLLEIAGKTSDPAERTQAFEGYVKLSATRDGRSDKERLDRMKQAMKEARSPTEQSLVINRCRTAYDVDAMRFVLPYVEQADFAQIACETIVELAHHREVRDRNKAEFDKALDQVIKISKDEEVVERAERYKRGETWERRKK
ncbi:MAG TPA: HEAT repeat domain-containing protein [Pirellulales bacterium]|nr:HEAT repeat domain-containing protein [Pirellulales bacterium]